MRQTFVLFAVLAALSAVFAVAGSGAPSSCTISPSSVFLQVGGSQSVAVSCSDLSGNVVPCPQMQWSSTIGSFSASGDPPVFLAGASAGSGAIIATEAGPTPSAPLSCSISANVLPGAPYRVSVSPESATVSAGSQQQFSARLFDRYGNEISSSTLTRAFSWSLESSDVKIGTVSQSGLFSAAAAGSGSVVAVYSSPDPAGNVISGSARVTVISQSLTTYCSISPADARISVKTSQQFSVKCYQDDPRAANAIGIKIICPSMLWSATDGQITPDPSPSIEQQSATFYAGTLAHKVSITAYEDSPAAGPNVGMRCSVDADVIPGTASSVAISPTAASLYVGDSQQFSAIASDSYGNSIPDSRFGWSTTGGVGSVNSNGYFTSSATGSGTVKVEVIMPGPLAGPTTSAPVTVSTRSSGGSGGGGSGGSNNGGGSFASSSTVSYTCAGAPASLKVRIFRPGASALAEIFYLANPTVKVFSATVSSDQDKSVPLAAEGDYELRVSVGTDQRTADFYVPKCTPATVNVTKNVTIELKEPPVPTNTRNVTGSQNGQEVPPQGAGPLQEEGLPLLVYVVAGILVLVVAAFLLMGTKKA